MLQFAENAVHQTPGGVQKVWTISEILETYDPLAGEPLTERAAALRRVAQNAEAQRLELSERARLCCDFWKQFNPRKFSEKTLKYSLKIANTYYWELAIGPAGLLYKDISSLYHSMPGFVSEQLLSDFWFYGPSMPIPNLETRRWLVERIRDAFDDPDSPAAQQHFELFEYPQQPVSNLEWTEGDYRAKNYIMLRDYGIEIGRTTWYDGLVYSSFISFERFLRLRPDECPSLTPEIREEIRDFLLAPKLPPVHLETANQQAPEQESALQKQARRLQTEHDGPTLVRIAREMMDSGITNVETLLAEAAENASPVAKQGLVQALSELFNSDKATEVLLSLLDVEPEDSYWPNYVFRCLGHMRHNRAAQRFLIECLQGDDEKRFKGAVDALCLWGIHGDTAFTDRSLLLQLNWDDATAADPDFRKALEKTISLITQEKN